MSGVEVVGLALGAFPVILEAIKAYKEAHEKVQIFKQAAKQLHIVDAQFRVCRLNFLNECRLLLDLILNNQELSKEMIADTNHRLWNDQSMDEQLAELLREHLDACAAIVADTCSLITEFKSRLSKFQKTPTSSGTLQRARNSAAFALEKSRFDRNIENLRRRNADLSLLRMQLTTFGSRPKSSVRHEEIAALRRLSRVRTASDVLHRTLKKSWSCLDKSHLRHSVKLCIESDSKSNPDYVSLDMAISCEMIKQLERSRIQSPLIWLYVQSDSIESAGSTTNATSAPLQGLIQTLQQQDLRDFVSDEQTLSAQGSHQHITGNRSSGFLPATVPSRVTNGVPAQSSRSLSNSPRGRVPALGQPLRIGAARQPIIASETFDICKATNICLYFHQNANFSCSQSNQRCLGYLKSHNDCKYLFYPPSVPGAVSRTSAAFVADEVTSLVALIERSQRGPSELLHQYQLALKITQSVLQFHNTAWLEPTWKLRDLSIFGSELSDQTLVTLHLSTHFESGLLDEPMSDPPDTTVPSSGEQVGKGTAIDPCYVQLCPGIYNKTLFSLGIALLEIAHWRSLHSMNENDPNEFYTAHRLVRGRPPLGPKYRKVVERCLRCDFGVGSEDLMDNELQQAVWSKVVSPIEALIRDTS